MSGQNIVVYILIIILFSVNYLIAGEKQLKSKLKELTPLQYSVTQKDGTEPPFKNRYWDHKEDGIYVDIVSGEALFSSKDKYESGTGWPSFSALLEQKNVVAKEDSGLFGSRTEVRSKDGNSHLGHVFNDGPKPTGMRYCINSASLRFIAVKDLKKEGYEKYINIFNKKKSTTETATLGAGCFWGVEAIYQKINGVIETDVGYMGGHILNPKYSDVTTGNSGHAEVVQIKFDSSIISYKEVLDYFFRLHDPTTLNRQGVDIGPQYRSAIFYHDKEQRDIAATIINNLHSSKQFTKNIISEITDAKEFYKAEDYHQDYYKKMGSGPICHTLRKKI